MPAQTFIVKIKGKHIQVFSNPHRAWNFNEHWQRLQLHKQLNHELGFDGTLLFTAHHDALDPWVTAQWLCADTTQIPLVAVNPIYMHPFTAARKVSSLALLYKRKVAMNWITGTAKNDLQQLNDHLDKADRYRRLDEYIELFSLYLRGEVFDFEGAFYSVKQGHLSLPKAVEVQHFAAGSSSHLLRLLEKEKLCHLSMLPSPEKLPKVLTQKAFAFGLVLGENDQEARERAVNLFPKNRMGEKQLQMALLNTDSIWKKQMAQNIDAAIPENGYWRYPMAHFSEVPFMVTSANQLRSQLMEWQQHGLEHLVISLPEEQDYQLLRKVFD